MKFLLLLFLLVTNIYAMAQQPNIDSSIEANGKKYIGQRIADFSFLTTDSMVISKDQLKGKVVFINFWSKECTPCIAEFHAFNELYDKLKTNPDFEFISLTYSSPEIIKQLKQKYGMPYKIASVKWPKLKPLLKDGYPTSIVIDRNGIIKYAVSGGYSDLKQAKEFVLTKMYAAITREL